MNWLEMASTWLEMYGNTHVLETDSFADTTSNTCIFWLRGFKVMLVVMAGLRILEYLVLDIQLSQMLTGYIPLLTRGPFALFYGGQPITGQLSSRSAILQRAANHRPAIHQACGQPFQPPLHSVTHLPSSCYYLEEG